MRVFIDEQGFGRAADPGAAQLGVKHDGDRDVEIRATIDVGMADAFQVGEHRHAGLGLHALHQGFAATGDDHVDVAVQSGQHEADGGTIRGGYELDAGCGQIGGLDAFSQAIEYCLRRVMAFRAAAQDRCIAGFERESASISRHVGAALVDDADDAEGDGEARDVQAVGTGPVGEDAADGIWEGCDFVQALRDGVDALFIEHQAVDEGGGAVSGAGGFHVAGVGCDDAGRVGAEGGCGCREGGVFGLRGRDGKFTRGGAGALPQVVH